MHRTIVTLLLGLGAGCSSVPGSLSGFTLHSREVVLSREHPRDDFINARLVSIAEDGTTRIQTVTSSKTLEAAVGGYFVGTNAYGTQGLRLISASTKTGEAHLMRNWCEGSRR